MAPGLLWVGSAAVIWESTKERGFYGFGVLLAAGALLLVVRIRATASDRDVRWLGLAIGLSLWTTPLLAAAVIPPVAWCVATGPRLRRRWLGTVVPCLAGAAPWLAWNLRHPWQSLRPPSGLSTTYIERLCDVRTRLPIVVGTSTPWASHRTLVPVALAVALLAGAIAVATVHTRRAAPGLLLACTAGYVVLEALNGLSIDVGPDPRYLYPLAPALALVGAAAVDALPARWMPTGAFAAVGSAALVGVWGLWGMQPIAQQPHPDQFLASPGLRDVVDLLEHEGRTRAMTDLSGAQITWISGGRIRAASYAVPRFADLERSGWTDGIETYVLRIGPTIDPTQSLEPYLSRHDVRFRRVRVGTYAVYLLEEPVAPDDVPMPTFGGPVVRSDP